MDPPPLAPPQVAASQQPSQQQQLSLLTATGFLDSLGGHKQEGLCTAYAASERQSFDSLVASSRAALAASLVASCSSSLAAAIEQGEEDATVFATTKAGDKVKGEREKREKKEESELLLQSRRFFLLFPPVSPAVKSARSDFHVVSPSRSQLFPSREGL